MIFAKEYHIRPWEIGKLTVDEFEALARAVQEQMRNASG